MVTNATLTQFISESSDLKLVTEPEEEVVNQKISATIIYDSKDIILQLNNLANDISKNKNISILKSKEIAFYYFLKKIAKIIKLDLNLEVFESFISEINYPITIDINEFYKNNDYLENIYSRIIDLDKKRDNGQFFTPKHIAEFMVNLGIDNEPISILDPAGGGGIFESYMPDNKQIECDIIEKDPLCLLMSKINLSRNKNLRVNYINDDFLFFKNVKKYDLIIANPPYIRFQGVGERDQIISKLENELGIKVSRLINYYALFFYRAISMLKENGRLIFITPSDYLNFNYGVDLKSYMKKNCDVNSIITFDNGSLVFDDNLSSACITILTKNSSDNRNIVAKLIKVIKWDGKLLLNILHDINKQDIASIRLFRYKQHELNYKEKWNNYFEVNDTYNETKHNLKKLSNYAKVCRGIATGANNYYILSKAEITKWGIENHFIRPVLEKSLNCKFHNFIESDYDSIVNSSKPSYLLYIFSEPSNNLLNYIKHGEDQKIQERYLPSKRKPWYSMEKREPARIWAGTFSRNGVKFVLNNSNCLNLTTFHGIYPKTNDENTIKFLVAFLNSSICKKLIKRVISPMGGGLDKLQPKDIENILVPDLNVIQKEVINSVADKFDNAVTLARKSEDNSNLIKEINDIFSKILK